MGRSVFFPVVLGSRRSPSSATATQAEGTGTIVVHRAQHIACLASYLEGATRRGMMIIVTASTPRGSRRSAWRHQPDIFVNPIAAGIPTDEDPILVDTIAAMSEQAP
ncbi:Ldh family oxidoreductase [Rhizobium etli]|uniref:Ldh family oxidoreductase n=1 Tax=Rhizobium etli TaxID=29449 RepID=UPI0018AD4CE6|nr:Ldh family oxidoreductase [Rhizobium etli]